VFRSVLPMLHRIVLRRIFSRRETWEAREVIFTRLPASSFFPNPYGESRRVTRCIDGRCIRTYPHDSRRSFKGRCRMDPGPSTDELFGVAHETYVIVAIAIFLIGSFVYDLLNQPRTVSRRRLERRRLPFKRFPRL